MSTSESNSTELITRLIAANNVSLLAEIKSLKKQINDLSTTSNVVEYKKQTISELITCNEPLDVIKSLPEFSGNCNDYVSWREAAGNSLSLYVKGNKKYFSALTILRNKIVKDANATLTNHSTVLNFDAIIARISLRICR